MVDVIRLMVEGDPTVAGALSCGACGRAYGLSGTGYSLAERCCATDCDECGRELPARERSGGRRLCDGCLRDSFQRVGASIERERLANARLVPLDAIASAGLYEAVYCPDAERFFHSLEDFFDHVVCDDESGRFPDTPGDSVVIAALTSPYVWAVRETLVTADGEHLIDCMLDGIGLDDDRVDPIGGERRQELHDFLRHWSERVDLRRLDPDWSTAIVLRWPPDVTDPRDLCPHAYRPKRRPTQGTEATDDA